jgi:hypothetical protein
MHLIKLRNVSIGRNVTTKIVNTWRVKKKKVSEEYLRNFTLQRSLETFFSQINLWTVILRMTT